MRRRGARTATQPKRSSLRWRRVDRTLMNVGQVIVGRTRPTTAEPMVDPPVGCVGKEMDQLVSFRPGRRDRAGEWRDPLAPPRRTPRRLSDWQIAMLGAVHEIASGTRCGHDMPRARPSQADRRLQVITATGEGRGFDQGEHQQRPAKERNRSTQPSDDRGADIHADVLRSKDR